MNKKQNANRGIIFIFHFDALCKMNILGRGHDPFEEFGDSSCIIPARIFKKIAKTSRLKKLNFALNNVCCFKAGEKIGQGSRTIGLLHRGVMEFLPRDAQPAKEKITIALARYWKYKKKGEVVIVSEKKGIMERAGDVTVLSLGEAVIFQKEGVIKINKQPRFRRHTIKTGVFGRIVG